MSIPEGVLPGIYWSFWGIIAAAAIMFIFRYIFVAPFKMNEDIKADLELSNKRLSDLSAGLSYEKPLPLVDFSKLAIPEWEKADDEVGFMLWDLAREVRQEALREHLIIEGKKGARDLPALHRLHEPHIVIQPDKWMRYKIDINGLRLLENDNNGVIAYESGNVDVRNMYCDLQIRNVSWAMKWLEAQWPSKKHASYNAYLRDKGYHDKSVSLQGEQPSPQSPPSTGS